MAQQSVYAAATLIAHESQHRVQGLTHGLCQQVSGGGQVTQDHADLHTALHSKRAQGGALQWQRHAWQEAALALQILLKDPLRACQVGAWPSEVPMPDSTEVSSMND